MDASEQQLPKGLMAIYIDLPPEAMLEFAQWCDTEFLPGIRTLPDVLGASRFEAIEGSPNTLVVHELETLEALRSPEYVALSVAAEARLGTKLGLDTRSLSPLAYRLRVSRATAGATLSDTPILVASRFFVKPGHEAETRAWLDEEHSVRQLTVPGALAYYGYEPLEQPFHFLNLWALRASDVQSSAAWAEASKTPRRDQVMQGRERLVRGVYTRA